MLTAVLAIVLLAIILVMATLGAVLLARFMLPGQSGARRVFAAAVGGPAFLLVPAIGIVVAAQDVFSPEQVIGFGFILFVGVGVIGWPTAHLATRRLDRLTRYDPQVFE